MEHPPKQGLKQSLFLRTDKGTTVLMEHPPKQGLKLSGVLFCENFPKVLMEHPPKQGLKRGFVYHRIPRCNGFNGTSTKTRIETSTKSIGNLWKSAF